MSNVRPHASYVWSCSACGATNEAAAKQCATCRCPAAATVAQIEASFAEHVAKDGSVVLGRSAAGLRPELSAWQVFGPVALVALGVLPSRLFPSAAVSFAIFGSTLLLVSYSVIYWAWPPVGFEASALVAVACLAGAALCFLFAVGRAVVRIRKVREPSPRKDVV